ncbi:MAG: hypothetical protein DWQ10_10225 [Calditrichaeota bacterium]|nr:MAG: hypothetical protein DWQ10_10225 [Calditrichota bacterium]
MPETTNYGRNRRRGPDKLIKAIHWLAIFGWINFIISLVLFDKAKPDFETFFDRLFHIEMRTYWNESLAFLSFSWFILCIILSITGLIINKKRHRRKTDEYRWNLIVLAIISLIGAASYLYALG